MIGARLNHLVKSVTVDGTVRRLRVEEAFENFINVEVCGAAVAVDDSEGDELRHGRLVRVTDSICNWFQARERCAQDSFVVSELLEKAYLPARRDECHLIARHHLILHEVCERRARAP